MLHYTMTENEIKNEIDREYQFLIEKANYRWQRFANEIKKENKSSFPICKQTEIVTPNNNKGYLVFVAQCRMYNLDISATAYFIMRNALGRATLVEVTFNPKEIGTITTYSAHFFDRYVERLGLSVKGVSAIEHFITHYLRGTHYQNDGKVFESYPFGIGLGVYNDNKRIMYINTFVSKDLLFKEQRNLINLINQHRQSLTIKTIL